MRWHACSTNIQSGLIGPSSKHFKTNLIRLLFSNIGSSGKRTHRTPILRWRHRFKFATSKDEMRGTHGVTMLLKIKLTSRTLNSQFFKLLQKAKHRHHGCLMSLFLNWISRKSAVHTIFFFQDTHPDHSNRFNSDARGTKCSEVSW